MVWLARFRIGLNSAGAGKRQASELLMSENPSGISRLVMFGDSLSDNGNLFRFTGEPAPPYWEGRFSNGPTYAEQLANELGAKLDDLAFGGADALRHLAGDLEPQRRFHLERADLRRAVLGSRLARRHINETD
jgi:hypothetical protein